ncbi:hypothetical protein PTSG_13267 [Salpingoeca rosetta]|uniref:Uncharacterized protein n=1 Tax=Salpingoeca rosetta (strain ATCC 50818 / BSB-021) TaxID=946362 RepID=F2URL2_SALR5|nr:hypothetical protein PTSG_13267 [Salpingoeca rosetta]|eukprot:XP_004988057.1 hypothetical protein PTSG_13267 [Salpingoeca rosetta]
MLSPTLSCVCNRCRCHNNNPKHTLACCVHFFFFFFARGKQYDIAHTHTRTLPSQCNTHNMRAPLRHTMLMHACTCFCFVFVFIHTMLTPTHTKACESDLVGWLAQLARLAQSSVSTFPHHSSPSLTNSHLPFTNHAFQRFPCWNDPSAGSPTETLLRLLLPLNDQV